MSAELYYRDGGNPQGPPVLLVHAFPTSHALWEFQLAALGETYRLIRPDLRGFGQSPLTISPSSMRDFVDDLTQLLDQLEVSRVNYVGISMGGMIGQAFALAEPQRVQSLSLCMTTSAIPEQVPDNEDANYFVSKALFQRALATIESNGMEPVVEMCLDRWFTPSFRNSEAARRVGEIVRRTTPSGYRGGVAAMSAFDVTEQLVEINCPTLVLPAELDQGTPVSCSEIIAERIPDARLEVITSARHIAVVEQPDACNRVLLSHLDRYAG